MTEREAYIHEWIKELATPKSELGGFSVCPYASGSKTLIVETTIDDIVPEPGHDVIVFIVEDFWRPDHVQKWVKKYNEMYPYYVFFDDLCSSDTFISGVIPRFAQDTRKLVFCDRTPKLLETYVRRVLNPVQARKKTNCEVIKKWQQKQKVD